MTNNEAEKVGQLVKAILDNRYARPQLVKTKEFMDVVVMIAPNLLPVVEVIGERDGRKSKKVAGV